MASETRIRPARQSRHQSTTGSFSVEQCKQRQGGAAVGLLESITLNASMRSSHSATPERHGAGGASVDVRAWRAGDRRRARVGGAATTISRRAVPGIGRASDSSARSQGYHRMPSASSV